MPPVPALPKPPEPVPAEPATLALDRHDLLWIAREANVLKVMGERRVRTLTIDYVPARPALLIPRFPGDEPITPMPPHVEPVTFNLEDSMFGGELFTSLTSRGFVVVMPFPWVSWDNLAISTIVIPK